MIGIPRSLFYYYDGYVWISFFKRLNIDYIVSPTTNKDIISMGEKYANDEMCASVKNYLGHIAYLQDKCDYILIPRIDNYGTDNQTCTNFLAMYDLVNNLFDVNILNYNINYNNKETLRKGLYKIGIKFKKKKEVKRAINYTFRKYQRYRKKRIINNIINLKSSKRKILLVSHPYNTYDEFIGKPIINMLKKMNIEVIYSDLFNHKVTNKLSYRLSKDLYWKYSKDNVGSIDLVLNKVDGFLFLSTFPCALDSMVNELMIRKINKPCLNIVIDDLDSLVAFETRIESFVDIINQ